MSLIASEVKLEYRRTTKTGVTVIVTNVPTRLTTGPDGEEIKGYSVGVALRLEELVKYALEGHPAPGSVTTLEF
jgi:hypothetical protein